MRERSVLRQLIDTGTEITGSAFQPEGRSSHELLEVAEQKVFRIAEAGARGRKGFVSMRSAVKDAFQHRVLYYGVLGALVLRLIFVAAGSSLVAMFGPYALAGFGLFVLWSAWKMWQHMGADQEEIQVSQPGADVPP